MRSPGAFDVVGAIGLAASLVCLLVPVTKGTDWGWTSPIVLALFASGAILLVAWAWFELRVREPVVDLRTSTARPVLLTNLASICAGFAMYANRLSCRNSCSCQVRPVTA